uniref:Uncharacterized protein n=1 Tax=Oryza sativa subsp. japonica TaxID=39947 RepID=Q6Z198_ORYSJ|nr:hypothetical protein [Oryza sativa Japonica Group]BAD03594.1 hypothetical protein [Oryza sativa Japonica Group]
MYGRTNACGIRQPMSVLRDKRLRLPVRHLQVRQQQQWRKTWCSRRRRRTEDEEQSSQAKVWFRRPCSFRSLVRASNEKRGSRIVAAPRARAEEEDTRWKISGGI